MSDKTVEQIGRRDFLKRVNSWIRLSAAAAFAASVRPGVNPEIEPGEKLKVGDITVHFLPFDHLRGQDDVEQKIKQYNEILAKNPNAIPIYEYIPIEISKNTGYDLNPDSDGNKEWIDIKKTYGELIKKTNPERIIGIDPVYDNWYTEAEITPIITGLLSSVLGISKAAKKYYETEGSDKKISRRDLAKIGLWNIINIMGLSTLANSAIGVITGMADNPFFINPPKLPELISANDFRMLTVAFGLEQLGIMSNELAVKDVILIYPQKHINEIKEVLSHGAKSWSRDNLKFDLYKVLYLLPGITNIRQWVRLGQSWGLAKKIPIDFK